MVTFGLISVIGSVPAEEANTASHTRNHYPTSMAPSTSLSQQITKAICHSTQIEALSNLQLEMREPPQEDLSSGRTNAYK